MRVEPVHILLVEDSRGDAVLVEEALSENKIENHMHVVYDGEAAMQYLHRQAHDPNAFLPDIILLDLNLPRVSGHELLAAIKAHDKLRAIPVIILTTSDDNGDIMRCYKNLANSYITKPVDLDAFMKIVKEFGNYWFSVVKLPPRESI